MKHIRKRQSLVRLIVSVLFCLTLVLQVFPAKAVDYTITITLTATPHLQKMTMTVAVTTSPKTVAFTGFWVDIYRSGSKVDVLEWRDSVGRDVDGVSWNFTSSFDITNGLPSEQTLTFVCYVYNAAGDVVSSGSTSKDPPINHNYSPAWYEPATCTDPGYSVQQCSTCGYTVNTSISGQPALGHDYSGSTYVHDSTTAGSGSKHYRVCQRSGCGYREVSTCKLDIIDMVVVTCTDQSSITQQCSNCGYTIKTVVQEPLGHSFTNYIPDGNAACTTDGTKTAVCDRCTETDTIADSGSALGHSFTNYIPDSNATCTHDGTKTAVCDRCTETDTIAETGSALGHSFTNYISDGNATCTHDGTKTAVCDRCTETDTIAETGSALGHSFTNYIPDGNATCTHDGTKSAVCDRCTETDTIADSGSALGHDLQRDASRDVAATCTTAGMEAYTCSRCPEHDDAATVALGHVFQRDASRDVAVACTAQGLEAYTCSRCVEKMMLSLPRWDMFTMPLSHSPPARRAALPPIPVPAAGRLIQTTWPGSSAIGMVNGSRKAVDHTLQLVYAKVAHTKKRFLASCRLP